MIRLILRLTLTCFILSLLALLITRSIDGQPGDPDKGAELYYGGRLACTECHNVGALSVPPLIGIASRVESERLNDPANAGESVALYLAESIIDPNRYVVPGYLGGDMPHYAVGGSFGLTISDLNNLVAFLMTL
jgi:hypothetical protein